MKDFIEQLENAGACTDAVVYVKYSKQSLPTLLERTDQGAWLVWLAANTGFKLSKRAEQRLASGYRKSLAQKWDVSPAWIKGMSNGDLLWDLSLCAADYKGGREIANIFRANVSTRKFLRHLKQL